MIWTSFPSVERFFRQFVYPDGAKYSWFENYSQTVWMGLLGASFLGAFSKLDNKMLPLKLTVIGAVLFEMIFEPRARHLLAMLPIFCLLAVEGVEFVSSVWGRMKGKNKSML